jgi:hypothetical protein
VTREVSRGINGRNGEIVCGVDVKGTSRGKIGETTNPADDGNVLQTGTEGRKRIQSGPASYVERYSTCEKGKGGEVAYDFLSKMMIPSDASEKYPNTQAYIQSE